MSATNGHSARCPLPDSGIAELKHIRIYRVSGPGTDAFLQGQFSQNLAEVTVRHAPRAAASSPKGRAYLLTRLVRDGSDVLLAMPDSIADHASTQLNKYLMLFRGTTMTLEADHRIYGLLGEEAATTLAGNSAKDLNEPCDVIELNGNQRLIRTENTASGISRYELWSPRHDIGANNDIRAISETDWQASEIAAGIALLSPDTLESYVPQMLNWQHLNGVHFKKGCYTGQEVIARMHYLGQLKKSLFRLTCPLNSQAVQPGMAVMADERQAGEVVNCVRYSDGHQELLAVLRHDVVTGTLKLGDADGPTLTLEALPYRVPEQESVKDASKDT